MKTLLLLLMTLAPSAGAVSMSGSKRTTINIVATSGVSSSSPSFSGTSTFTGPTTFGSNVTFSSGATFGSASGTSLVVQSSVTISSATRIDVSTGTPALSLSGDIWLSTGSHVYWGDGLDALGTPSYPAFEMDTKGGVAQTGRDSNGLGFQFDTSAGGGTSSLIGVVSTHTVAGTGPTGFGIIDTAYGSLVRAEFTWLPDTNDISMGGVTSDYGLIVEGFQAATRFFTSATTPTFIFQKDNTLSDLVIDINRASTLTTIHTVQNLDITSDSHDLSLASNIGAVNVQASTALNLVSLTSQAYLDGSTTKVQATTALTLDAASIALPTGVTGTGYALCVNTGGNLSHCTSGVGIDGSCTCP
ncbi:MAG: hypothetical protein KGI98_15985 [Euryarchaeota archaeon]|nr:hypothetical protein [Euryarchaeota archaeon]